MNHHTANTVTATAEWIKTARVVIAQADEEHPPCCDWCVTCTRCSEHAGTPTDCLPRRMASVMSHLIRIIEAETA